MERSVVAALTELPLYLREHRDVSPATRVREILESARGVKPTEGDISADLASKPHLVDAWSRYADDQRCSSGWYVREPADSASSDGWELGHMPSCRIERYSSGHAACAAFIVRTFGLRPPINSWR